MSKISQKVLIISAWLPGGGIEKVIQNLYLDDSPFEDLKVLSLSTKINYRWHEKFSEKVTFLDCFKEESNVLNTIFSFIKSIVAVFKYLKNESPSYILFSHSFLLPVFGILRPECKIFYWPQDSLTKSKSSLRYVLTRLNYLIFSKSIDGVLCVNETIEIESYYLGFKKVHLIYNPIGESAPNQFNFDPSCNKLVHIGFLDDRKNASFIIKAMAETYNHNLTLDIIGNGVLLNQLIKEAIELGVSHKVNFKGFVDLKNQVISCSALIMASKSEGFSMVISDASKCGLPIILPDNLDISRFVKSNSNLGSIFSLSDLSSLVEVLNHLNFSTINSKLISRIYINEYGNNAFRKRLFNALN